MRLANRLFALVPVALILGGCGGGGGLAGSAGGGDFSTDFGNGFLTRGRGAAVYPIPGTGSAVFVAAAGGDITYLGYSGPTGLFKNSRIAYANRTSSTTSQIWVMNADGSGAMRLTDGTNNDQYPSISADGTKIVFQSNAGGNLDIYSISSQGGAPTRLTTDATTDTEPAISPDGQRVAFVNNARIWVMDADGSNKRALTSAGSFESAPAWSPDGARLAFRRFVSAGAAYHIFTINSNDGTGTFQVTQGSSSEAYPAYSPDGGVIAFTNQLGSLYTIKTDGTGVVPVLTGLPYSTTHPVFSPDGQKIAYGMYFAPDNQFVAVCNRDGTGVTKVGSLSGNIGWPSMSGASLSSRVYVGAAGADRGKNPAFGAATGGFISSLNSQGAIGDVISFDCASRDTITVDTLYLGPGAGLVGAVLNAATFTNMLQDNGRDLAPTKILGAGGIYTQSVSTVEVFYDRDSGKLVSVVPISRGRGPGDDVVANGRYLVRGQILAAIDLRSGQNLAPNGAKEVSVDPATGQIMGVK